MIQDATTLLSYLWRGGQFAHFWTPNTGDFVQEKNGKLREIPRSLWFELSKPRQVPDDWAEKSVHFSLHPSTQIPPKNAQGKKVGPRYVKVQIPYIAALNCVFADFDFKDWADDVQRLTQHIHSLPLEPSVVVATGGGYHCYWLYREPQIVTEDNRSQLQKIQYAWCELVNSDPDAKDIARVPRLPGYYNKKEDYAPHYPLVSVVHADYSRLYEPNHTALLVARLLKVREEQHQKAMAYEPGSFTGEVGKAAEALSRLSQRRKDSYREWIEVGMSLSGLGPAGLQLWEDWSRGSEHYEEGACEQHWRSFKPNMGKQLGSLMMWADEDSPRLKKSNSKRFRAAASKPVPKPASKPATPTDDDDDDDEERLDIAEDEEPEDENVGIVEALAQVEREAAQASSPDAIEQYFIAQSADDEGNAQCVAFVHGKFYLFTEAYGWLHYNGRFWDRKLADRDLRLATTQTLIRRRIAGVKADREAIVKASRPTVRNKSNTITQFQDLVQVDTGDFDSERHLLNCKNGVIDLRIGKLVSHTPSDRFTYCVDAEYDPEADQAPWTNFLADVVGDYEDIHEWLQMAGGYSATGYTNEECAFYIYGPSRSGKGTFANCLLNLLGKPLSRGVAASMFTMRREGDSQNFDLAPLKPARLIFASETNKYQKLNGALLRQITGNDEITAAFKGKDQFTYVPNYKIWFMSNSPVKPDDPEEAANWGRLRVIHFPKSYLGKEDKHLKEHLSHDPKARQALLAYLVEGAMMWFNEPNGLVTPKSVAELTKLHQLQQDTVKAFIEDACIVGEGLTGSAPTMYTAYVAYCTSTGREYDQPVTFGRSMSKKGHTSTTKRTGAKVERVYTGIMLKD